MPGIALVSRNTSVIETPIYRTRPEGRGPGGHQRLGVFRRLFGSTSEPASQEEVTELTNQFYVTLRAYFAKVKAAGTPRNKEAFDRVEELLKPERTQTWNNAYEIEQLLVHLFDDRTLAAELGIRTLEARAVLGTELADFYEKAVAAATPSNPTAKDAPAAELNDGRRTLLSRLVNDLQWRYIAKEATRRYSKLITRRTALLAVLALVSFAIIVLLAIYRPSYFTYENLSLLLVAGFAGSWGATFSMLTTLKGRLDASKFDDLKLMRAWWVLVSRALIGAGAACILFFFLLSGLLGGTAFPRLARETNGGSKPVQSETRSETPNQARVDPDLLPKKELALLIVWCFLAGFSEQLIPGLLATTEARANGRGPATPDRHIPTTGTTEVQPPPDSGPTGAPKRTPKEPEEGQEVGDKPVS